MPNTVEQDADEDADTDLLPGLTDDDSGRATRKASRDVVRLSVNLAPDVAATFRDLCHAKRISITEGVRRAIAIWRFVEDEVDAGRRLAVIEEVDGKERVRELLLV